MFKLAVVKPSELWKTPGIVKIIAKLLDAGATVEFSGNGNNPKLKRHVVRLARRLHCGYWSPINSREPLALSRSATAPISEAERAELPSN